MSQSEAQEASKHKYNLQHGYRDHTCWKEHIKDITILQTSNIKIQKQKINLITLSLLQLQQAISPMVEEVVAVLLCMLSFAYIQLQVRLSRH